MTKYTIGTIKKNGDPWYLLNELRGYEDQSLGSAHGTIDITSASIGRAIGSLNTLSKAMLGVAVAAGVGLVFAIDKAADFEQQMARFGAVGNSTEKQMEAIRQKALELGRDSGYGATEVVKAFTELAYAGATAEEIMSGLGDATIYLARAGEIPLADAAVTLINTLRQFGLTGKDAINVADEIARAANASTITIEDLNTSLRYVGATAASMNIPFRDVAQAIAILGNQGIRGSTAGTTLRGVLVGLLAISDPAKEALHTLGLDTNEVGNNFFTAEGKLRSFKEIAGLLQGSMGDLGDKVFDANGKVKSYKEIQDLLNDSTVSLTDKTKLQAFATLFMRRAMSAAFALAREGPKAFDDLTASQQYNTTAQEIMEKKLNTLQGSWQKFKAALENAAITLGTPLLGPLKVVTDALADVADAFAKLDPDIQNAIAWFLVGTVALFGFGFVAFRAAAWFLRLYRAMRDLNSVAGVLSAMKGGSFAEFLGSVIGLVAPFLLVAAAVAIVIAGFAAMWIWFEKIKNFLEENPWAAALIAIVAPWLAIAFLIVGALRFLYDHASEIWDEIEGVFNDVVDWLTQAWDDIKQAFNDAVDFLTGAWDDIKQAFNDAKGTLETAFNSVLNFFRTLPGKILSFLESLPGKIGHIFEEAGKGILTFLEGIPTFLQNLPTYIGAALEGVIQFLSTTGVEIMMGLLNGLLQGFLAVLTFFILLPVRILTFFVEAVTWLFNAGVAIFTGLIAGLTAGVVAVWEFFIGLIPQIINFFGDAINWLNNAGMAILQGLWNGLTQTLPELLAWFVSEAIPGLIALFDSAATWLVNAGIDVITGLWNAAEDMWTEVIAWFGGFFGNILDAVGSLIDTLAQAGRDVITGLWNGAKDIWESLWNWLRSIPDWVVTAVGDLGDALVNAGKALIQGLIDGVEAMTGPLRAAVGVIKDIVSEIGDFLGIGSPSKLTFYWGQMSMAGLVKGLQKGMPELQRWVSAFDLGGMQNYVTPSMAGGGASYGPIQLIVNVNGDVANPQEIGRQVGTAGGRAFLQEVRAQRRR